MKFKKIDKIYAELVIEKEEIIINLEEQITQLNDLYAKMLEKSREDFYNIKKLEQKNKELEKDIKSYRERCKMLRKKALIALIMNIITNKEVTE